MAYDAVGNVVSTTNALGVVTAYSYDALNRRLTQTDAYGTSLARTVTTNYDADDNIVATIDALDNKTSYGYDALSRQISVLNADGGTTTTAYDANDNVLTVTDELGHSTNYVYDLLNRKTQTTDARGGVVKWNYDADDNLLTLTDPVNNVTQWVYDALDRKVQEIDPLGNSEIYVYDAFDRLTSSTDRNGQQIASSYDVLNRKTGETWYNASGTQVNALTWSYDADNNLLTAVNNTATTTMTYDTLDRLSTVQDTFGTMLTNTYDAADNRTQVQDSFGALTTRIYDVLNRIASLQLGGTSQTPLREDFTYTARDQVATQTRYSDLAGQNKIGSSTFGYDSVGRSTNLQHVDGSGNNIANYVNAFDLASRITSETLNGGTPTNYSYDVTNELTNDSVMPYSYDLNGNRTMSGYTTGPANEFTSDGIWNYVFDPNGNVVGKTNITTGETWVYGYDNRNRLISATQTTSAGLQMQATYVYDALGQRIEKDVWTQIIGSTVTTRFAYDGREIWADLDASNALQTRYVRGERVLELLARIASGMAGWILADRMGSVRNVVDNTGAVIDTIVYDGYGNVTSETTMANGGQYKYDGYRVDSETGWYRPDSSTGRYFNPWTGNWMGRDPIRFIAGDENLYRYVSNSPTNAADSLGENVKREYSRPSGTVPPYETARIKIALIVDTSACKMKSEKCEGNVKLSMTYTTTVTVPGEKVAERYAKQGVGFGLVYEKKFYPFVLEKATLAPKEALSLGEISCDKGEKKGTILVSKEEGRPLQQRIVFKVEISCCGKIENEKIDAVNEMGGTGGGEGRVQPLRDVDLAAPYLPKGSENKK